MFPLKNCSDIGFFEFAFQLLTNSGLGCTAVFLKFIVLIATHYTMWTRYQLFIAVGMVITGSINTLATKYVKYSASDIIITGSSGMLVCSMYSRKLLISLSLSAMAPLTRLRCLILAHVYQKSHNIKIKCHVTLVTLQKKIEVKFWQEVSLCSRLVNILDSFFSPNFGLNYPLS